MCAPLSVESTCETDGIRLYFHQIQLKTHIEDAARCHKN